MQILFINAKIYLIPIIIVLKHKFLFKITFFVFNNVKKLPLFSKWQFKNTI